MLGNYSSYSHYPVDPSKPGHTILTVALGVFAYCHRLSGSCNTPVVDSLAEDCKLSACGRQPVVNFSFCCPLIWLFMFCFCFGFHEICLLFKFRGALSYVTPNLHHPVGIVFLATLGTICRFGLGVG